MFTGIIQSLGILRQITPTPTGARLIIDSGSWNCQPAAGDSIAINGVCLTYTAADDRAGDGWAFDAVHETLARSTLGQARTGDRVNLEAALTASTPMGGHFVQGHVDGVGEIKGIDTTGGQWRMTVRGPGDLMPAIVPKGSVAIDGISLTIASVDAGQAEFDVAIIPTTLALTTLGRAKVGQPVNIETDIIARTVVHALQQMNSAGGLTLDKLREAGFA